jgi:glycosyltransferase involved in cell wall biosynthesis
MPEPRHIVFLTTDFRPMVGGVADHLHRMADHLAAHTPVTVMTTVPLEGASWPHAYRLVSLDPLPDRQLGQLPGDNVPPLRKLRTGAHFLALRRRADRLLADIKAQSGNGVAVVIGIWDTASHFWCDACHRAGVPYYIVAHGVELLMDLYGRLPRWRQRDFARSVRVIANSRATARLTADTFTLAIPPAVVNPSVGPRPAAADIASRAADLRRELQFDRGSEGPALLTVGRLVQRKGCDLVLRSVAELAAEYPGLRYIIAGDGPERARLDGLARELGIADRVRMLGDVDDLTKWAAYDICDVFVSPTQRRLGRVRYCLSRGGVEPAPGHRWPNRGHRGCHRRWLDRCARRPGSARRAFGGDSPVDERRRSSRPSGPHRGADGTHALHGRSGPAESQGAACVELVAW